MAVAQRPRCHVQRFFEELGFNLKQAHGAERPSSQRAQGLRRFVVAAPPAVDDRRFYGVLDEELRRHVVGRASIFGRFCFIRGRRDSSSEAEAGQFQNAVVVH